LMIHHEVNDVSIPLSTEGTIIFAESRTPTIEELENCRHIHLTSDSLWNPKEVMLSSVITTVSEVQEEFASENMRMISSISCVYDSNSFGKAIISNLGLSDFDIIFTLCFPKNI
jgi:hypothetical protein